jgi:hypothetical protein
VSIERGGGDREREIEREKERTAYEVLFCNV